MREPIRLLILGTGHMGSGIARLVLRKPGLRLVGAYARRSERGGIDLGSAIGLDRDLGIAVMTDLDALIAASRPDVAIQATCSTLVDARAEIATLLGNGIHVISIAEEMASPACASPEIAGELDGLAVAHDVSVLGTGINPGFVLDTLIIALTGVCADVTTITATRVNDLSPYGKTVLKSQGVGLTPEAFRHGVDDGSVVGHVGFPQSINMIAKALGWRIERIEETREPIIAGVRRETDVIAVEPGQVAGCRHTAVAYKDGHPVITLIHPQQVRPELEGVETGDSIEITGAPDIRLAGSPEIPGGEATVAIAVNSVPAVLNAPPGLHTMADLPLPSAMLADMRTFLDTGARQARTEKAAKGTWVEIHTILLAPGERAPQVPEDTQAVPLEMRTKGFLIEAADLGEEVTVTTAAGRRLTGTLAAVNPPYAHGFGAPIPELSTIGIEVRALLSDAGDVK